MKKGMTSKEEASLIWNIEDIDPEENACKILDNPEEFFKPYLKNIAHPALLIIAKFSIYYILIQIDGTREIGEKTSKYFMERCTIQEWLDKLRSFYSYCIETIDFLTSKHDDAMLDLYNEGNIDKDMLQKAMITFQDAQKEFVKEKELMEGLTREIEKEKERVRRNGLF